MKNQFNKNFIIIVFIFLMIIFASIVLTLRKKEKNEDMREFLADIDRFSIEFRSERGFGNDRFDIYSFSFKEPRRDHLLDFPDDDYREIYKNFMDMIEIEVGDDYTSLKAEIKILEKTKDLKYESFTRDGTKKLYLFSPNMNKGYCLILTI